ncbi:hypothetical protein [Stieleria varia]|nr:hypothetical protein [Stieleria varia]
MFNRYTLSIALAFVSICAVAQDSASELTIAQVLKGLQKTEEAVQSVSVTMQAKRISENSLAMIQAMRMRDQSTRSSFTEQWQQDRDGRGWNRAKGQTVETRVDGTVNSTQFDVHATFDGRQGAMLRQETREDGTVSRRGSVQAGLMRTGVPPLDLLTHHQGFDVSELLTDGAVVVGNESWDGHRVIVVESNPVENNGEYKSQYWIDPQRDYVVVRRRNLTRRLPEDPWQAIYSVDCFGHQEIADGVWAPKIAWTRMFGLTPDGIGQAPIIMKCDVVCADWELNVEIPEEQLTLEFPPGLRVNGLREAFQAKIKPVDNFIVTPITTELQRMLLGDKTADVYAEIDVTAYVDVNTLQITPAKLNFAAFQQQLKQLAEEHEQAKLYLKFEFGGVGAEHAFGMFVKAPVEQMCKESGFESVRVSSRYANGDAAWKGLPEGDEAALEDPSHEGDWRVYPVATPLGRHLLSDTDVLIDGTKERPLDAMVLLDDEAKEAIQAALSGLQLGPEERAGRAVTLRLTITAPEKDTDEPHLLAKEKSEPQLAAVEFLRSLGFGNVHFNIRQGYRVQNSNYVAQ